MVDKNSIVDPEKILIRGLYDLQMFCQEFGIPQSSNKIQSAMSPTQDSPSNFSNQIDKLNKQNQYKGEDVYKEQSLPPSIFKNEIKYQAATAFFFYFS